MSPAFFFHIATMTRNERHYHSDRAAAVKAAQSYGLTASDVHSCITTLNLARLDGSAITSGIRHWTVCPTGAARAAR